MCRRARRRNSLPIAVPYTCTSLTELAAAAKKQGSACYHGDEMLQCAHYLWQSVLQLYTEQCAGHIRSHFPAQEIFLIGYKMISC